MAAPYVNHTLYKEELSSMACGDEHTQTFGFSKGSLLHSALKHCTLGET